ncbi:MAG: hypothetical protein JO359_11075 [Candidatus Eremiobacteraeota bacterium]|nr:hypothetical protein [Candidatus Eremiobacteraeota bacterium]
MDRTRGAVEAELELLERAADEGSLDHIRAARLKAALRRYVQARELLRHGGTGDEPVEEIAPIRRVEPI